MAQQDGFDFRGIRLDGIDEDWLSGLIGLRENDYLDVKLEMYGGGDSAKRELAADVTSIANAAGGLIVIGASEEDGVVVELVPQAVAGEETRVRQILVSNISPYLSDVDVAFVPSQEADLGYLLISVGPSPEAPHAVVKEHDHRFPVRDGSTTRYMGVAEFTRAVRRQLQTTNDRISRARGNMERALGHRNTDAPQVWLTTSFTPSRAGSLRIDRESLFETRNWWAETRAGLSSYLSEGQVTIGSDRFTIGDFAQYKDGVEGWHPATSFAADLWLEGSVAITSAVSDVADEDATCFIYDEWLATRLLSHIAITGSHMARTWAGGNAEAVVELRSSVPMSIGHKRDHFTDLLHGSRQIATFEPIDRTVEVNGIVTDASQRVSLASSLGDALVNCFGAPHLPQFTEHGAVNSQFFGTGGPWRSDIERWCKTKAVEFS